MKQFPVLAALALLLNAVPIGIGAADAAAPIQGIGVENHYADVISQVGGKYVQVQALETDPNTDPHSFEASPKVARSVAAAQLIVLNGLGYDDWVGKIVSASDRPDRAVINVQKLLGLPDSTPNPHLWYDPKTMPAVARAVADALAAIEPEQAAYFQSKANTFIASLGTWNAAIAGFKAQYANAPIAATEPVANYLLEAMGFDIATPFRLQAAIMNGTDPAPQDISLQNSLFANQKVKAFVYNRQVTNPLTNAFLETANRAGIPVVGVYETMPTPGFTYQTWMLAETAALKKAITDKVSTATLKKGH